LVRSLGVGALATVVDLVALWLLVEVAGLAPWLANVPALGAGLLVQFAGNKYLAFGDRSRALLRQGSQFALVEVGALGLNALGFHLAVTLLACPYLLARLSCSAVVYVAYSFPLWGRIFTHRSPNGLSPGTAGGE
jgi:putative flippase GtrA